jgi:colicin import membrane protein
MSVVIDNSLPQLDAGAKALEELMGKEAKAADITAEISKAKAGEKAAPIAPEESKAEPKGEAAAKPGSETETETQGKQQQQPAPAEKAGKARTAYGRDRERIGLTWDKVNAEKDANKAERAKLEADRKAFEAEREKAKPKKFTAEEYEKYADQAERAGKFDLADLARAEAERVRKEPKTEAAPTAAGAGEPGKVDSGLSEEEAKEWITRAGTEFPDAAKDGTPTAVKLRAIVDEQPGILDDPVALYYGARLATAEAKAELSDSQAKEIEALRAKVKDLETRSTPSSGGVTPPASGGKAAEDVSFEELERQAMEVGPLR